MKISKLGAVAASAGRLFQLDMVRGRKLNWLNCLVTSTTLPWHISHTLYGGEPNDLYSGPLVILVLLDSGNDLRAIQGNIYHYPSSQR